MNFVGRMVQRELKRSDTVLDIGCGVMQATMDTWKGYDDGRIKCRSIVGIDAYRPYLERIKDIPGVSAVEGNATDLSRFVDKSFDVCLALDLVEHLELADALHLMDEAERIARRKVLIFTPSEYYENAALGFDHILYSPYGKNELQRHRSLISQQAFKERGYQIKNIEWHRSTFAVKALEYSTPTDSYPLMVRISRKRSFRWLTIKVLQTVPDSLAVWIKEQRRNSLGMDK